MAQRITVMLDDNVVKALRNLQAKQIKSATSHVSFSK